MNDNTKRKLSKLICKILRHDAELKKLPININGYMKIEILINYLNKIKNFTQVNFNDIQEIVNKDKKKRYSLKKINNYIYIRANQGHSIKKIKLDLIEIIDFNDIPICIHGTYLNKIEIIKKEGLSRMNRNHIHMSINLPELSDQIISGMRQSCNAIIWIDVEKAMDQGIKFFKSENNVILSSGNEEGKIPSSCFKYITDRNKKLI